MPGGPLDAFKNAFLGHVRTGIEERLQSTDTALRSLEEQIQLLRAVHAPDVDERQKDLELATEAKQMVVEQLEQSWLDARSTASDLSDAIDVAMKNAGESLARRKKGTRDAANRAVGDLVKNPANAWLADGVVAGLKKQLADGLSGIDTDTVAAVKALDGLPQACVNAMTSLPKKELYDQRCLAVEQDIAALKRHPQAAHVRREIDQAEKALRDAKDKASKHEALRANIDLGSAQGICRTAVTFADSFHQYTLKRAKAGVTVAAVRGIFGEKWVKAREAELRAADDHAKTPNRRYLLAEQSLEAPTKAIADQITKAYDTSAVASLKALRGLPSKDFIDEDIQAMATLHAQVQAAILAKEWHTAVVAGRAFVRKEAPAKKMATRHKLYTDTRKHAIASIDKLKAYNDLFAQVEAMRDRVASTDRLAERKVARFEEAIAILSDVIRVTHEMKAVGDAAAACRERLPEVRERFTALSKHSASRELALDPIKDLLDEASAEQNAENYESVLKLLDLIGSQLSTAEALASKLAASTSAQKKASGATDAEAIQISAEALRQLIRELQSDPHAELAKEELARVLSSLDEVATLLEEGDPTGAQAPLQGAAALLVTAQTVCAEHARFLAVREKLQGRVDQLKTAKAAVPNKPNIDRVEQLLEAADAADQRRAWQETTTALQLGALDADTAELASKAREDWDTRANRLKGRRDRLAPGPTHDEATRALEASEMRADQLNFVLATSLLDDAELCMNAHRVAELLRTSPRDDEVVAQVHMMMAHPGGPRLVDDMIKNLPDRTDRRVYAKLAKARFGIVLDVDDDKAERPGKTSRRIFALLAMVPEGHVRHNPSLRQFRREAPTDAGGFYQSSEDLVVMKGRPSAANEQQFGTRARSGGHAELPGDVEESCQPVDEKPVNFFDFATLHEVGHAVDDRLGFMASRLGQEAYGGWIVHGGDLASIAEAVAKARSYDKDYVLTLLQRKEPVEPEPPNGTDPGAWNLARDAVKTWYRLATWPHVYRVQAWTEDLAIAGRVYQEAYAGTWVSYKLEARKRALTGYQFRAPGEWFAELYAGFYSGKLKDGHPAARWLRTL